MVTPTGHSLHGQVEMALFTEGKRESQMAEDKDHGRCLQPIRAEGPRPQFMAGSSLGNQL